VDLVYDEILGRNFLQRVKANISYASNKVTFEAGHKVTKEMFGTTSMEGHTKRSEIIVELPVEKGEDGAKGIIDKLEVAEGMYVASSLRRIEGNKAIVSILNTREEEVMMGIP
jgi:hypothetical protein